jgi:hypothetical protein
VALHQQRHHAPHVLAPDRVPGVLLGVRGGP